MREDQSLLHRPRNSGRECAWWTNSLVGQYLHQLSLLQSSRSIQRMQPKHCFFVLNFEGGPVFASQTKKLRKRMYMVDQLPCGSVLTPAISCTKFKIHSAHADSPLTKTLFLSFHFCRRSSLCFTDQETQEENVHGGPTPLWVSTYTNYLLYKVQDPFSACRQSINQKNCFFLFTFEGGPVFASQTKKLRKRMCMVDQLSCGSVLTPAISCTKVQDPFSA